MKKEGIFKIKAASNFRGKNWRKIGKVDICTNPFEKKLPLPLALLYQTLIWIQKYVCLSIYDSKPPAPATVFALERLNVQLVGWFHWKHPSFRQVLRKLNVNVGMKFRSLIKRSKHMLARVHTRADHANISEIPPINF